MPGIYTPASLPRIIANLHKRIRALETQQQAAYSNLTNQVVMVTGRIPGSNPPAYGLQLVNPSTQAPIVFLGENSTGTGLYFYDTTGALIASFDPTGLTVHGTETVSGTENISGNLNVTGTAMFGGNTSIGGNLDVTGTLSLPNGIINNAALADPVEASYMDADANSLTFTGSPVTYAAQTVSVPSGFSQAVVMVTSTIGATAVAGGGSYIEVAPYLQGGPTVSYVAEWVEPSTGRSVTRGKAALLTGLGSTVQVGTAAYAVTPANLSSGSCNAHTSAILLFLR